MSIEAMKLAREGVEIHSPTSPEYIVCKALLDMIEQAQKQETDEVGTGCECPNCANGMGLCHTIETQAQKQEPVALPTAATKEANEAIEAMLLSYNWPCNTQNAGRAGWEAARKYLNNTSPPQRQPLTDEEFISMVDSDGIRVDPQLAFTIKEMVEKAHGIYLENSDCHGRDWTERDEEYLK